MIYSYQCLATVHKWGVTMTSWARLHFAKCDFEGDGKGLAQVAFTCSNSTFFFLTAKHTLLTSGACIRAI